MEKKDLKNGMFVELQCGTKGVVVGNIIVMQDGTWDNLNNYKGNLCNTYKSSDIVKVYNCTCFNNMTTAFLVWERPKEILDKQEKEYLRAVIKPFKNRIYSFSKIGNNDIERVTIKMNSVIDSLTDVFYLPVFKKGTMYKGMEIDTEYTLEELGL